MLPTIANFKLDHTDVSTASKPLSGLQFDSSRHLNSPKTRELITQYEANLMALYNSATDETTEPVWWQKTGTFPRFR